MGDELGQDEIDLAPLSKSKSGMRASLDLSNFRPITTAEIARTAFIRHLRALDGPAITLVNTIDDSSPPLGYRFIKACKLGKGVTKADDGFMAGCECRPNNGRNVGCEFTKCECLREAELGPNNKPIFPYYCSGPRHGCLRDFYLDSRNAIFECNKLCRCHQNCKNRNVQHGRQVKLEIFKTANRGWGTLSTNFYPAWERTHIHPELTHAPRTPLSSTPPKGPIHRHIPRRNHHQRRSRRARSPRQRQRLLPLRHGQIRAGPRHRGRRRLRRRRRTYGRTEPVHEPLLRTELSAVYRVV